MVLRGQAIDSPETRLLRARSAIVLSSRKTSASSSKSTAFRQKLYSSDFKTKHTAVPYLPQVHDGLEVFLDLLRVGPYVATSNTI